MKGSIELRSKLTKGKVGTWRIEIPNGKNSDGSYNRIRETFRGTREEAKLRQAEILIKLSRNEYSINSNMSLRELYDKWFNTVERDLAPKTQDFYKRNHESYILPEIGNMPISKIQPTTVNDLLDVLRSKPFLKSPNGLSTTAIRHVRSSLSACLSYAVDLKLLSYNPCSGVTIKGSKFRKIKKSEVWTPEQAKKFLKFAESENYYMYFKTALETGMRPGEITAMRWIHINFNNNVFTVEEAIKQNDSRGLIVGDPKTSSSTRVITVREDYMKDLELHLEKQNAEKIIARKEYDDKGLVFANPKGKVINLQQLRKVMRRVIERANKDDSDKIIIPQIPLYNLRHTHATLLLLAGVSPKVIQERLGHKDITVTLNIYSIVIGDLQKQAMRKIDGAFIW